MHGTNREPFTAPFSLPADSVEITLDLPMPPSTNEIWRYGRGRMFKSDKYVRWAEEADIAWALMRQEQRQKLGYHPPRQKITSLFEFQILLSVSGRTGRDGDNYCKAALDWCQSRDFVRNDSDCRRGSWEWVEPERAPKGCRVVVRSLHEPVR